MPLSRERRRPGGPGRRARARGLRSEAGADALPRQGKLLRPRTARALPPSHLSHARGRGARRPSHPRSRRARPLRPGCGMDREPRLSRRSGPGRALLRRHPALLAWPARWRAGAGLCRDPSQAAGSRRRDGGFPDPGSGAASRAAAGPSFRNRIPRAHLLSRYRRSRAAGARSVTAPSPSRAEILTQAREAFRLGQLDQAEALYRELLTAEPDDTMAYHMLGLVAHQREDLPAALALIGRAVATRPDFAHAHQNLGVVQQKMGDIASAAASYRHALALKGDLVMARVNLAGLLQQQGQPVEAIKLLRAGLKQAPGRFELHNNLGLALLAVGRAAAAIAALRKTTELAPHLALPHRNLARALADTGRTDEAA